MKLQARIFKCVKVDIDTDKFTVGSCYSVHQTWYGEEDTLFVWDENGREAPLKGVGYTNDGSSCVIGIRYDGGDQWKRAHFEEVIFQDVTFS
jgi:hypothetical protein